MCDRFHKNYFCDEVYVDIVYDMQTGEMSSRLSISDGDDIEDHELCVCRIATHMTLREISSTVADIVRGFVPRKPEESNTLFKLGGI